VSDVAASPSEEAEEFGADLECVVADTLKFKRKLRIGEDTYAVLRLKKSMQLLWDVGGVAATGATVAASPIIAGTFFASSAGLLGIIGIGAAATPIGWVIAAAAATGGAYYGVTRMVRKQTGEMVDTIPRFINTPIDLLGMELFDLIGALALRVAAIDGVIEASERSAIERHFIDEWGFDADFVARAIEVLIANADRTPLKVIAKSLAEFQAANPDCNGAAMQAELMRFLRDVMKADGVIDEREEHAIDAVETIFKQEKALTLSRLAEKASALGGRAGAAVDRWKKGLARPPDLPKTVS
jgi:uncharacterized membrane protein YebE (DUF533 family)